MNKYAYNILLPDSSYIKYRIYFKNTFIHELLLRLSVQADIKKQNFSEKSDIYSPLASIITQFICSRI